MALTFAIKIPPTRAQKVKQHKSKMISKFRLSPIANYARNSSSVTVNQFTGMDTLITFQLSYQTTSDA